MSVSAVKTTIPPRKPIRMRIGKDDDLTDIASAATWNLPAEYLLKISTIDVTG
ncbi:MAG: hypothetical protein SGJ20_09930 [Planctomycetota bacterium]|nr:hypothetical protein [Planctomycetota bacterium]